MGNFTVYTSTQKKVTGGFCGLLSHFNDFYSAIKAGREDVKKDTDADKYFCICEKGKTGFIFHSNKKILLGKR